ncbi:hypothetical protein AWC38_SpisGene9979 [Stylophora pistillata]|uniref:Uncharacterized protein n=1 Tax=Stylophora pistillata TaxID=50429 RepID=A0A2B4S9W2_STYPI|nr:hypothetical protein AWC38_SpisGene9979 [Stylophora pistillata]
MNLNENASSVLLNGHDDSDEDGETASNDEPAKSADMDADLSALLASAGKDNNNEVMPGGQRPLEGIRAGLNFVTQRPQQQFVSTHMMMTQQVQAPPPLNYNQPPLDYSQPPPAYRPPDPTPYSPAQIQGQAVSISPPGPAKY